MIVSKDNKICDCDGNCFRDSCPLNQEFQTKQITMDRLDSTKRLPIPEQDWLIDENIVFADDAFQTHIVHIPNSYNKETREAILRLIADAGTTYNKCGVLPSTLLEQRDGLLKFLTAYRDQNFSENGSITIGDWEEFTEEINKYTE